MNGREYEGSFTISDRVLAELPQEVFEELEAGVVGYRCWIQDFTRCMNRFLFNLTTEPEQRKRSQVALGQIMEAIHNDREHMVRQAG